MVAAMIVGVAALVLWARMRILRQRRRAMDRWWRPRDLQDAPVVFSERTFRTWRPFPLVARVDRGMQVGGVIVLVELKTRARHVVYRSDVIELSAQKLAIEGEGAWPVSSLAYVVTEQRETRSRKAHQVALWDREALSRLARRRSAILNGDLNPKSAEQVALCRGCALRQACRDRFGPTAP
jgi:hypothetical protein